MRNDLIELLALLVSVGYIKSFRVTKTYIYVTMKNDRRSVGSFCGRFLTNQANR